MLKKFFKKITGHELWRNNNDILHAKRSRSIGLETTNICNAKCSFCSYDKSYEDGTPFDARKKTVMSKEVHDHTVDLYNRSGGGLISYTALIGEPTVDKDFLEKINYSAKKKNITEIECYTNGILLDKFDINKIITSGLTKLSISTALGSKDAYKRLYGKDYFERVYRNIVNTIKENKHRIDVELLLRLDKPFERFYKSNIYKTLLKYLPKKKIKILEDDWFDWQGIIKQDDLPHGHQFVDNKLLDKRTPCYALYRKLTVLVDGTMQVCSTTSLEPELQSSNILNYDNLEDAFLDKKFVEIRNNWLTKKEIPQCCQTCNHYHSYQTLKERSFFGVGKKLLKSAYFIRRKRKQIL